MVPHIQARRGAGLVARVVRCQGLYYAEGGDEELDRPDHVRAGSGLAWVGDKLVVVQDDANFLAVVDLEDWSSRAVMLPAGPGGKRLFGDDRGNKRDKWDLESGISFEEGEKTIVLAFGSGSTPQRFQVVIVVFYGEEEVSARVVDASTFYENLQDCAAFAGCELNLEGAALCAEGEILRLAQRANGAPLGDRQPLDVLCEVDWPALWRYLNEPGRPAPKVEAMVGYDLGGVDGVALNFTEITSTPFGLFYLAAAEDTPTAYDDGPVVGTALGLIVDGQARYAPILDLEGRPFLYKTEGLAIAPGNDPAAPRRAYLVTDRDDPILPAELCEVHLEGPWFE